MLLAVLEVLGLAGLFVYFRAAAKRREVGKPRPGRVRDELELFGAPLPFAITVVAG